MKKEDSENLKIVLTELGSNPFQIVEYVFVLMFGIPLLVVFYLISKEKLFLRIFLGENSIPMIIAIMIALIGFLYAYLLIRSLVSKLLHYAEERKIANHEKNEIMQAVAHDLKNPLSVIKNSLDNLADGIGGTLNGSHPDLVKTCLSMLEKLFHFINEITKSSTDDFLKRSIAHEDFDLGGLIKKTVEGEMPLALKSRLSLRCLVPEGATHCRGDADHLERVVANLVSNAIKYTPQGGTVDVKLSSDPGTITFSVINSGPGLKPEEMQRIFKKFGRLGQHEGIEGTGLGLAIVKDIVDLHNGHITVQSELGKNTEFKVILPQKSQKTYAR